MSTELPRAASPACEIVSTRTVKATPEIVYAAWTNPEHLKTWWGPHGFTNTFEEFDLRIGGRWRFVMHGPEAGHYKNDCEFTHIHPPHAIAWKRYSQPLFLVVATFEAIAPDQTEIVFRQIFDTEKECGKLRPYVVDKNEENFDRLEVVLANMGDNAH